MVSAHLEHVPALIRLMQTEYSVKGELYPRENVALRNTLMLG
jgi:hypothetical protein